MSSKNTAERFLIKILSIIYKTTKRKLKVKKCMRALVPTKWKTVICCSLVFTCNFNTSCFLTRLTLLNLYAERIFFVENKEQTLTFDPRTRK